MKVLAVHPSADLYGSDRMFLAALAAARDGGADVVAHLPGGGPLEPALATHGVEVIVAAFPVLRRSRLRGLHAIPAVVRWVVALPGCLRVLARQRPDVVYVSTVVCPIWVLAAALARRPVVVHVHENEPDMRPLAAKVLLAPLRLATTIVANSTSTRSWLTAVYPRLAARTIVVDNGLAAPLVTPRADRPEPRVGASRLVVIGRLSERKGQEVVVRAAHLLGERGYEIDLSLVGASYPGYEDYPERLQRLAERSSPRVVVHLSGFAPEPWPALAAADVAVVPSTRPESFGNVAVEALLAGVPTVATDVPGLREIIRHGETGLLVPPGRPEPLADAIAQLIDDPTWARQLAVAGQQDVRQRFGLERYEAAMRELLCSPEGGRRQCAASTRRTRRRPSSVL